MLFEKVNLKLNGKFFNKTLEWWIKNHCIEVRKQIKRKDLSTDAFNLLNKYLAKNDPYYMEMITKKRRVINAKKKAYKHYNSSK